MQVVSQTTLTVSVGKSVFAKGSNIPAERATEAVRIRFMYNDLSGLTPYRQERCGAYLESVLFDENSRIRFYVHKIRISISQRNQNRPRPNSLIYIFNSNNVAVGILHPVSRLEFISSHPTLSLIHSFSAASGGGKSGSSLTANLWPPARKAWGKPASFAMTLVWRAVGYE